MGLDHEAAAGSSVYDSPPTPPLESYPPPPDDPSSRPSKANLCTLALIFILPLALLISTSSKPWYALLFGLLAVLPAAIVAKFLVSKFSDPAVTSGFLVSQFIIGFAPLALAVIIAEGIASGILAVIIFYSELPKIEEALEDHNRNGTAAYIANVISVHHTAESPLPSDISKIVPLWKVILFSVLTAFLVAGAMEEIGKWLIARRYHKINQRPENVSADRQITCRGVISVACMGALGFATFENIGYVFGVSRSQKDSFPLDLLAMTVLRGILAFPVHVGTQFYIAVSAASQFILGDPTHVMMALFVAILFHGTFDAVSFLVIICVEHNFLPKWIAILVPIFDLVLITLLLLLCRGRYKAMLERERVLTSIAEPV